jgi:hypothetical protein
LTVLGFFQIHKLVFFLSLENKFSSRKRFQKSKIVLGFRSNLFCPGRFQQEKKGIVVQLYFFKILIFFNFKLIIEKEGIQYVWYYCSTIFLKFLVFSSSKLIIFLIFK